ncbi:amidase [Nitratireductor basaltis]|uniref:Amidase n=1 Tax=Nitratireductor basaltis TaxID=472175 RepID=A0A084U870_9HYPH|nr:amidase [Nitratireductor basaltis]KFB09156.1 Amidase [Nitratireductor basaltis]
MTGTRDALNAFLDYPSEIEVPSSDIGPLAGLTLGVKDIFDVRGLPTGGGNPQREKAFPCAEATASPIARLLDAGAQFLGKTQTEELTYSMIGLNAHFPSPVNPEAPERVTGGSSSGSAAAVAGGLCDIAAGSDTNGSIRAPASFCGLLGLRTTHGRIPLDHTMALAPSFDTFGWFARNADIYERVAAVLLGTDTHQEQLLRPMRVAELETLLFGEAERAEYARMLAQVNDSFHKTAGFLALPGEAEELFERFKEMQAYEAWQVHGPFLMAKDRNLGPGVKERFDYASAITQEQDARARQRMAAFRGDFEALMNSDMVVIMPSQPSAAPLKDSTQEELERYRVKALTLTSIAALLGWPQISIPLGQVHGAPFGISLLGPKGSDRQLVSMARDILHGRKVGTWTH